ncbi:MAG TPA: urea transporter [Burkholderiaceae bacterium]|nr:urea transporter [Burkholderiaceae bacterium]
MSTGTLPAWRQWLRGLSQCAFQANETTGALFAAAVAVYSVRMAGLYLLGAAVGTLVARLARANAELLDLGLFGFNAALIGLALGNFFEAGAAVWLWATVLGAVATLVAVAMVRWLPWPFLAAPFIVTLWAVWPFVGDMGLTKIDFDAFAPAPVHWVMAVLAAPGQLAPCARRGPRCVGCRGHRRAGRRRGRRDQRRFHRLQRRARGAGGVCAYRP